MLEKKSIMEIKSEEKEVKEIQSTIEQFGNLILEKLKIKE